MPAQTDELDRTQVQLDLAAFDDACKAKGLEHRGRRDLLGGDDDARLAMRGSRIARWRVESAAVALGVPADTLIRAEKPKPPAPATARTCLDCGADITRRPNAKRCLPCAEKHKKVQNREASRRSYQREVEARKKLAAAAGVRDRGGVKKLGIAKQPAPPAPVATPGTFPVDQAAIVDPGNVTPMPAPRGMAIVHADLEVLLRSLGLSAEIRVRDLWAERLPILGVAPKLVVVLEGPGLPVVPEGAEIPHMDAVVRTRPPFEMEITR